MIQLYITLLVNLILSSTENLISEFRMQNAEAGQSMTVEM